MRERWPVITLYVWCMPGHLEMRGTIQPGRAYVELGAGKGLLSQVLNGCARAPLYSSHMIVRMMLSPVYCPSPAGAVRRSLLCYAVCMLWQTWLRNVGLTYICLRCDAGRSARCTARPWRVPPRMCWWTGTVSGLARIFEGRTGF